MKNKKINYTTIGVLLIIFGMISLSYAAVPLYDLFCRTTGFGGTPVDNSQISNSKNQEGLTINVLFNSDVARGLDWNFIPAQRKQIVKLGENNLAFYKAKNSSIKEITGVATFNVSPPKVGKYFTKIDCFCFEEQTLTSGQEVEMPVNFYIDPEIATDPNTKEVKTITLSYTFFNSSEEKDYKGKISKNFIEY